MVHFVGAGSGAVDHHRAGKAPARGGGRDHLRGVFGEPGAFVLCKNGCEIHNSAKMTLEEVISVIKRPRKKEKPPSASTPETPASMALCASSLTGWRVWNFLRCLPRRERILRRGGRASRRIYASERQPDGHHHKSRRQNARARARIHTLSCRPSGDNGALSEHIFDRAPAARATGRRVCRKYTGRCYL